MVRTPASPVHRAITQRLRAEADAARVLAPPHLRARTMAALATTPSRPATRSIGWLGAGRIAACLALAGAAVLAVSTLPGPAETIPRGETLTLSTPREVLAMPAPWDEALGGEVRHLVADARRAGRVLLARLPRPFAIRRESGDAKSEI